MTDTLALPKLYAGVQAVFTAEGTTAALSFGWREPSKQINQGAGRANRIVFVPGDPGGALGKNGPARYPGRNPKPLATLAELFTVYVWAYDPSFPENELVQYKAARFLYDAWYRAAYHAARGTFAVSSAKWNIEKNERRFGAEIEAVCTIDAMIPDSPWPTPDDPVTAETSNRIALRGGDEVCCET